MTENRSVGFDELHIWHASLSSARQNLDSYTSLLSEEEKARADRFRFQIHRERFIAARGILRSLLGDYLGISAASVKIEQEERGKPYVSIAQNRDSIRFNLSHSDDFAVYAFAREAEVGIDIEVAGKQHNATGISRSYFTDHETELLNNEASESQKQRCFLNLWTRKEACIKCTGDGLGVKLDSFDVSKIGKEPSPVRIGESTVLVSDLFSEKEQTVGAIAYQPSFRLRQVHLHWP